MFELLVALLHHLHNVDFVPIDLFVGAEQLLGLSAPLVGGHLGFELANESDIEGVFFLQALFVLMDLVLHVFSAPFLAANCGQQVFLLWEHLMVVAHREFLQLFLGHELIELVELLLLKLLVGHVLVD